LTVERYALKFSAVPQIDSDSEEDLSLMPAYWEEPKRLIGFPYTSFHHKTVDDLIKEKITIANKKMKEELERKEEGSYFYPSVPSLPAFSALSSGSTRLSTEIEDDQEEEEEEDEESQDLTELLKERLSKASQVVSKAKDLVSNDELRQTAFQDSKVPLGFEDIKEDEKGPFFDEIIEFLNPFLSGTIAFLVLLIARRTDRSKNREEGRNRNCYTTATGTFHKIFCEKATTIRAYECKAVACTLHIAGSTW
jgi:hypothetical protein